MLKQRIKQELIDKLGYEPTESQLRLSEKVAEFIEPFDKFQVLLIKGFAGTGKTTMVKAIVETLKSYQLQTVLLAPTGRAAKVLSEYTSKEAYTIHKKIYRQQSSSDGFGKFSLNYNKHSNTIFIVDEASMIANTSLDGGIFGSGRLLDDLIEFVFAGDHCKLILLGDTAQLPPVGYADSPALEVELLKEYLLEVSHLELTDVIRQKEKSGILENATELRHKIISSSSDKKLFNLHGFSDIRRVSGEELIESITSSYDKFGIENTMIICRSNKRANIYNQGIRNKILYREEELSAGDQLMVVKNNYFWLSGDHESDFIANGDILEVKKIKRITEMHGFRFADIVARFPDYELEEIEVKIILDTLTLDGPSLNQVQNNQLFQSVFEDYSDLKRKSSIIKKVKNDAFFNALQVKFAYAVTCHKAQGGQWNEVYLDQGYIPDLQINKEYLRWIYTAVTRSYGKLYLVNFPDDYFY